MLYGFEKEKACSEKCRKHPEPACGTCFVLLFIENILSDGICK